MPFRGAGAPTLTQDELVDKVGIVGDFHVEQFDLTDREQRVAYEAIMTRAHNGWYHVVHCDRSQPMIRVVEWVQRYAELSPTASEAARSAADVPAGIARPGPFAAR